MTESAIVIAELGSHLRDLIHRRLIRASTVQLCKNDIVYDCLAQDCSIYLVEQGQIKAVVYTRTGKECLLNIYTAREVFGESCLLGGVRFESTIAMTPATVRRISCVQVTAALADAGLREQFVKYLTQRLLEQQRFITDLVTTNSEYRLATVLLRLGRKLGTRNAHLLRIEERITQEELSAMVGTTRSRVGYFLKRFRTAGLIERTNDGFLAINEPKMHHYVIGSSSPVPTWSTPNHRGVTAARPMDRPMDRRVADLPPRP